MMVGTVIGVHYDGGYCYWVHYDGWVLLLGCIMMVGTVIGYIMMGTVIGVHYDGGYCYWGTL